jgi:two-component sensor histidine kinase
MDLVPDDTRAVPLHGALSRREDRLDAHWSLEHPAEGEAWLVDWRESCRPVASRAEQMRTRRGYGRELIEHAPSDQFNLEATYAITPEGVRCTITLPISKTQGDRPHV